MAYDPYQSYIQSVRKGFVGNVGRRPRRRRRTGLRPLRNYKLPGSVNKRKVKPLTPAGQGKGQHFTPGPVPVPQTPGQQAAMKYDPRDSIYYATLAQRTADRNQQIGGLATQQRYADEDYHEALRRIAGRRSGDMQSMNEQANREGLLLSGQLGKRKGEYETEYARSTGDMRLNYDRAKASRDAARAALEQGATLEEAALYAEAVDRQMARDAEMADEGALAGPEAPKPKPKPTAPGSTLPKGQRLKPQRVPRKRATPHDAYVESVRKGFVGNVGRKPRRRKKKQAAQRKRKRRR